MNSFFQTVDGGFTLKVRVQANAKKNEILLQNQETLKVRIQAKAQENRANRELICFLGEFFSGLPIQKIILLKGSKNKDKVILFQGNATEACRTRLYKRVHFS